MATVTGQPAGPVRLPVPKGFPVSWQDGDEQLFWTHDRMHAPEAMAPLDADIWLLAYGGVTGAAAEYELPIRLHARCFNAYLFSAVVPTVPHDQMAAQGARGEARLREAMGRLEASWNNDWLPEIQSHLSWWAAFDLGGASTEGLARHLKESVTRMERLWHVHFLIVLPAYMAISQFDEFYRDLFTEPGAFNAFALLEGFDNKTLEVGRALWILSRKAAANPDVRRVLSDRPVEDVIGALSQSAAGRAFVDDLHGYLRQYGQRSDMWGIGRPSWIEDPAPVLRNLKSYLSQPELDMDADHRATASARDRAVAEARARLKEYPAAIREEFEFHLRAAQAGTVLSEDHGFWIDFSCMYRVRCVFMELGARLARAGALESAGDVIFLTLNELLDVETLLRNPSTMRALTNARKAELQTFRAMTPPPVLGTDYGPPPDDAMGRFMTKFFGGPPPVSDVPNVVKGHAGSPGKAVGTARVIKSLDQAGRVRQGDILVAETTAPPWTPLFATVGAVVTDTGGILCHAAVVAREYGIPAVVGTGAATAVIRDGQRIEVDGDTGTIRVLGD